MKKTKIIVITLMLLTLNVRFSLFFGTAQDSNPSLTEEYDYRSEIKVTYTDTPEKMSFHTHNTTFYNRYGAWVQNGNFISSFDASNYTDYEYDSTNTTLLYTNYIRYSLENRFTLDNNNYMMQFQFASFNIIIDDEIIEAKLSNCTNFNMTASDQIVEKNSSRFNLTTIYDHIQMETYGQGFSELTLTLINQFYFNFTNSIMKIQAIVDLTQFRCFYPSNHSQAGAETPFDLKLVYNAFLFKNGNGIRPVDFNNETIQYSLNSSSSSLYNASTINMGQYYDEIRVDGISQRNCTSEIKAGFDLNSEFHEHDSVSLDCIHYFPNLMYNLTQKIITDPTLTMPFIPRVKSDNFVPGYSIESIFSIAVLVCIYLIRVTKSKKQVN